MDGHILRRPGTRHSKFIVSWNVGGKRERGRPKQTWRRTFKEDLERVGIALEDAKEVARDRAGWRQLADRCARSCTGGIKV